MVAKRVVVTGGAGFLAPSSWSGCGKGTGAARSSSPASIEYDLREKEAILRLYQDARPHVVIHLAGIVGGIGANLANPGSSFYGNLMMGAQLMHCAQRSGVERFVAIGTLVACMA